MDNKIYDQDKEKKLERNKEQEIIDSFLDNEDRAKRFERMEASIANRRRATDSNYVDYNTRNNQSTKGKKKKNIKNTLKKTAALALAGGAIIGGKYAKDAIVESRTAKAETEAAVEDFYTNIMNGENEKNDYEFSANNRADREEFEIFMANVYKYQNADNLSKMDKYNLENAISNYVNDGKLKSVTKAILNQKLYTAFMETYGIDKNDDIQFEYINQFRGEDSVRGLRVKGSNVNEFYSIYNEFLGNEVPNNIQELIEFVISDKEDDPDKMVDIGCEVAGNLGNLMFSNVVIKENGDIDDRVSNDKYDEIVENNRKKQYSTYNTTIEQLSLDENIR